MGKDLFDIIIIGAGTAGLSAAIYAARAGKRVIVLEERMYGGQIGEAVEVENYPGIGSISGYDFAEGLYNQAEKTGAKISFEAAVEIDIEGSVKKVITEGDEYLSHALIIASGLKKRKLGLDGEALFTGRGVSYCATCDGAFYRGKTVVINGGGNTAVSDALYLSDICSQVYIVHRRDSFRAEESIVKKLYERENITVVLNSRIESIEGHDVLERVSVADVLSGEIKNIVTDGLFICVGQIPQSALAKDSLNVNSEGYIVAGEDCRTNIEGVFAAGDCRTKEVRQLVTAAADGAVAALGACEYINKLG